MSKDLKEAREQSSLRSGDSGWGQQLVVHNPSSCGWVRGEERARRAGPEGLCKNFGSTLSKVGVI